MSNDNATTETRVVNGYTTMTDNNRIDQISQLKERVGKPIENVSQLSEFVESFNKAGVEVSYGTALMQSDQINGEPYVAIHATVGFDSESWNRCGTTITCKKDEHDGFIYRLSESSGWWFQFRFSLNCIVTNIEWEALDEYIDELPSIVISRFYMPMGSLLDEQKRRAEIIKSLESEYEAEVKSIGQVIIGPSEKIHFVHPDRGQKYDLTETFRNIFAFD